MKKRKGNNKSKIRGYCQQIISPLREPALILNKELTIISFNRAFCSKFKVSEKEILGEPLDKIGNKQWDIPGIRKLLKENLPEKEKVDNYKITHKFDGLGKRTLHLNACHLRLPDRKEAEKEEELILLTIKDITGRKEDKKRLEQYKKAVDAVDKSIFMIDKNYRYVFANAEHISRLVKVGHITEESEDLVNDKKIRDIYPKKVAEKFLKNVKEVLETGKVCEKTSKSSKSESWCSRTFSPVKNPKTGKVEAVAVISKDITEQKKAEEREEFLHSLLRHDVRNESQIVQGYLELLGDFDMPEKAGKYLKKAKRGIRESMDIIEKVSMLRKVKEEEVGAVKIEPIIERVVEENQTSAQKRNMKLEINLPDFNFKVQGGTLLKEVFANLVGNSIRHSGGSRIRIRNRKSGNKVVCIIEDDGKGVSGTDKEQIFEKGYTTDAERGTGIGMFLVKRLLDIYGGSIEVKDSKMGGARFDIHLQKA
ncbi:MAG: ATP-binding protein [Elusimicrobiota bacterium]